jgi:hypothetical protein
MAGAEPLALVEAPATAAVEERRPPHADAQVTDAKRAVVADGRQGVLPLVLTPSVRLRTGGENGSQTVPGECASATRNSA